jgi:hypothetical protein
MLSSRTCGALNPDDVDVDTLGGDLDVDYSWDDEEPVTRSIKVDAVAEGLVHDAPLCTMESSSGQQSAHARHQSEVDLFDSFCGVDAQRARLGPMVVPAASASRHAIGGLLAPASVKTTTVPPSLPVCALLPTAPTPLIHSSSVPTMSATHSPLASASTTHHAPSASVGAAFPSPPHLVSSASSPPPLDSCGVVGRAVEEAPLLPAEHFFPAQLNFRMEGNAAQLRASLVAALQQQGFAVYSGGGDWNVRLRVCAWCVRGVCAWCVCVRVPGSLTVWLTLTHATAHVCVH